MDRAARDRAVQKVLDDPAIQETHLWHLLSATAFLPSVKGSLKYVKDLYDPHDKSLQSLFEGADLFPAADYIAKPQVRVASPINV